MRAFLILFGVVLIALGVWVLLGHATYTQTETLVQFGPAKITATHDKVVPLWLGISGIVIGVLVLIAGGLRKR